MAKAAFVAATRRSVVLVASDRADFATPVRVGELLELTAEVTRVGRSSMTVSVTGVAEEPGSGARRPVLRGGFEMVAVDKDGRPAPIARDEKLTREEDG